MSSDTASPAGPGGPLSPSPEQRRAAAAAFDRATRAVAAGDDRHGIRLLLECCRLDPANLLYRQALRRAEKARYANNLKGGWFAWLFNWPRRARLRRARAAGRHLEVLELGERVLVRNPWDVPAHVSMADAALALELLDLAVWLLEQARHKEPEAAPLNRLLARLYERRGNFTQARAMWELVHRVCPDDLEAQRKITELAERPPPAPEAPVAPTSLMEKEVAALEAQVRDDPTRAAAHLRLARLHRQAGRLEQAHRALSDGLGPTGGAFELSAELADLEVEPFRRDLALTEARLAASPDDEGLLAIRDRLRKEINSRELDLHRLLADRHPAEPRHRYELGLRLVQAGQLDEAIAELQAARADERLRWRALLAIGRCFRARGNARLALRNFEEALAAVPADEAEGRKEALYELAAAHAEAGDLPHAIDVGTELAHLDFAHRDIGRRLDEWQAASRAQAS
jgi:tetratricopeptide (TPR) repeat protein